MIVPQYILEKLPIGLVGLALVALFAAAMSSLDSVINSLSASTMEDFVRRFHKGLWSDKQELWISRSVTLLWGTIAIIFSFYVGDIASSVLVAINKIGSLINGPVLGVFLLGIFTSRATGTGATIGLLAGFLFNLLCWLYLPNLSWLWWNVFGFAVCVAIGYGISCFNAIPSFNANTRGFDFAWKHWRVKYIALVVYTVFMMLVLLSVQNVAYGVL